MEDFLYPIRVLHGRLHQYTKECRCLSGIKKRICAADKDTVLFTLTPTHGNLGDHAIAMAVIQMLREMNIAYTEITVDELKLMQKHNKMYIMNGYPIIVNGGGNIGTLWPSVERLFRHLIQNCPESRILCLPNTAYFEESKQGQYEYEQSKRIYRAHKTLTICARERISYELLREIHNRVVLIPDMALSLNECKSRTQRKGCLLCLRSDREKTREPGVDRTILEQAAQIFGRNVFYSDMYIGRSVSPECRQAELTKKFDIFRSAELVITDRLHGMIFAAITGTACVVIDSKSPKVRGCYEWIQGMGYIRFAESPDEIMEMYNQIKGMGYLYSNDHLQPYYQVLKEYVTDILKK
ncbi:MAG: hypothetical protein E7465_05455 [Ruminococcaceae bacterium]|nr:hypothetical protein [Oscillospiraceae bacterium]